ncbi:hypothetical protein FB381_4207 [Nocardioides albertanoniae]|uniref:Excreted virulence factor EspC (Type VII ESX diderm) n=1 Tax=Nocardioides albertanoniae TaxID=1175486 RepID=A0A543ACG7_9ACTN|nr:hypothetical protein [Nocardioides albertanoniae]TQL70278.1 hypothetical protein FB381_4207 [Nocardioides albertanoniae]
MSVDVELSVLSDITVELDAGAEGLEGLAGGVPSGIDAGPMTAVITSMLSQIVDSTGNVSTAMSGAADAVGVCRRYYQRADADAEAGLDDIKKAMGK